MNNARISIFIDGPNFFHMQRDGLDWFVDPKKLCAWVKRKFEGEIVDARYYDITDPEFADAKIDFIHALPHMGYSVHSRPTKQVRDGNETWNEGNVTTPMMLDIIETKDQFDILVLVSGDGNFQEIIERLRQHRIVILGTTGQLSNDLRMKVGRWCLDFSDIKDEVARDDRNKPKPNH